MTERDGKRRTFFEQVVDYYEWIPEWSERAACIGRWDEFTETDINEDAAAIVCWSECSVRKECLIYTLQQEQKGPRIYEIRNPLGIVAVGVAGGYTASERLLLHESIMNEGLDLDTV